MAARRFPSSSAERALGWLQLLIQLIWWPHPLVWWASRQLSRERERCCDEETIAGLRCEPSDYAQCLIDVRRAIGDDSLEMVRTVPRRGYIFEVPVDESNGDDLARTFPLGLAGAALVLALIVAILLAASRPEGSSSPTFSSCRTATS